MHELVDVVDSNLWSICYCSSWGRYDILNDFDLCFSACTTTINLSSLSLSWDLVARLCKTWPLPHQISIRLFITMNIALQTVIFSTLILDRYKFYLLKYIDTKCVKEWLPTHHSTQTVLFIEYFYFFKTYPKISMHLLPPLRCKVQTIG